MSDTVPGGFYLQGDTYVDANGMPVKNEVLETASGAALARLPEKKVAELKLSDKQKSDLRAELDRREAEDRAALAEAKLREMQLDQILGRTGLAFAAKPADPTPPKKG